MKTRPLQQEMLMKPNLQIQHGPNGNYVNTTQFLSEAPDSNSSQLIIFENDGGEIVGTNYFDTSRGTAGMYYLSCNAGVARLLIPEHETLLLDEMKTGKLGVLTSGIYKGQPSVEIMFDDGTRSPFSMFVPQDQCDSRIQKGSTQFILTAWTQAGKVGEWKAFQRVREKLPCLQPWK
jgi:hypothetical protein